MDSFGDRANLLFNLDILLTFNKEERMKENAQDSLWSGMTSTEKAEEIHLEKSAETNPADKLMWEKELLGLYISGHPLDSFKEKLQNKNIDIKKLKETYKERQGVILGGIVEEVKLISTKNGDRMAFLKLAALSDTSAAVREDKARSVGDVPVDVGAVLREMLPRKN